MKDRFRRLFSYSNTLDAIISPCRNSNKTYMVKWVQQKVCYEWWNPHRENGACLNQTTLVENLPWFNWQGHNINPDNTTLDAITIYFTQLSSPAFLVTSGWAFRVIKKIVERLIISSLVSCFLSMIFAFLIFTKWQCLIDSCGVNILNSIWNI